MSWGGAKSGARLVLPGFIGLTADVAYFGFRQLSDFPIRLPPSLNGFGQLSDFPIRFLRLNAFGQLCTSFRRRGCRPSLFWWGYGLVVVGVSPRSLLTCLLRLTIGLSFGATAWK